MHSAGWYSIRHTCVGGALVCSQGLGYDTLLLDNNSSDSVIGPQLVPQLSQPHLYSRLCQQHHLANQRSQKDQLGLARQITLG